MNAITAKYVDAIRLLENGLTGKGDKNIKKCIQILEQHRDAAIKRAEQEKKPPNAWIVFVKNYCEENDITYRQALNDPEIKEQVRSAYQKTKKSKPTKEPKAPKEKPVKEPKEKPVKANPRWDALPIGFEMKCTYKGQTNYYVKTDTGLNMINTDKKYSTINEAIVEMYKELGAANSPNAWLAMRTMDNTKLNDYIKL